MKIKNHIIVFCILAFALNLSCKRYKEGPLFSLLSPWERVKRQKYIVEYTVNGIDSMQYLRDSVFNCNNFKFFFHDGCFRGQALKSVDIQDGDFYDQDTCRYFISDCLGFYKNNKYVDLPVLAYPFHLGYQLNGASAWLILRLTKDEMWLRAESNRYPNKIFELKFRSE